MLLNNYYILKDSYHIILKNNLENLGYQVSIFNDKIDAKSYLLNNISNKTVGFGGSVTLKELDLFDSLSLQNKVYWHDKCEDGISVGETRKLASNAQIYISSLNAISLNGEIVNIDNTGNRVSAISFGPEKVYIVFGVNKISNTLEDAVYRARNVASPLNAKRLNKKTPCAVKGDKCYNCQCVDRICRNLSILLTKPTGSEYEIIIINENLGY